MLSNHKNRVSNSLLRVAGLLALVLVSNSPTIEAQSGLDLLGVESGARSAGMGDAFVAVAGDPISQHYNPSATTEVADFAVTFGHVSHWENIRYESAFLTFRESKVHYNFGLRIAQISNIEARTIASPEPDYQFEARDVSLKFGLAAQVAKNISIGLALGWLSESINFYRGYSFNADIGAFYRHSSELSFGASLSNIGSKLTLLEEEISVPTTLRFGASYVRDKLLVSAGGLYADEEFHVQGGAEYSLHRSFALRAGLQTGFDSKNFSAGAGFSKRDVRVDYAFVPYSNDLGSSHQFSLSYFLK